MLKELTAKAAEMSFNSIIDLHPCVYSSSMILLETPFNSIIDLRNSKN